MGQLIDGQYIVDEKELNPIAQEQEAGLQQTAWNLANEQMPYDVENYTQGYSMAEPRQSDYVWSQDFVNKYFNPVSEEEEQKRVNNVRQANKWAHFGRVAQALGNAINVGVGGGYSQQAPEVKSPDVETWRKGLRGERQQVATMQRQQMMDYGKAQQAYLNHRNQVDKYNQALRQKDQDQRLQLYKMNLADLRKEDEQAIKEYNEMVKNETKIALFNASETNKDRRLGYQLSSDPKKKKPNISGTETVTVGSGSIEYAWAGLPPEYQHRVAGRALTKREMVDDIKRYQEAVAKGTMAKSAQASAPTKPAQQGGQVSNAGEFIQSVLSK